MVQPRQVFDNPTPVSPVGKIVGSPLPIAFIVPAVPVSQPERQATLAKRKDGSPVAISATPTRHPVNAFKATVAMAAREAYSGPPLTGPLRVAVVFVFSRPQNRPSWITRQDYPGWLNAWKLGRRVPYAAKKKHDRDNLLKALQDPLNGILWADDGLIYSGPVEKWIAATDEPPHVEITIEE